MVIDDDTTQLRLMKELLEKSGAEVTTEANSLTALKLIEEKTFDTVLTDLQMPVMDGFALVAAIRSNENTAIAELPVIVLSGRRDIEESEFVAKGFTAQLTKPVNITLLTQLISGNDAGKENTVQELTLAGKKSEKLFDLASLIPVSYTHLTLPTKA